MKTNVTRSPAQRRLRPFFSMARSYRSCLFSRRSRLSSSRSLLVSAPSGLVPASTSCCLIQRRTPVSPRSTSRQICPMLRSPLAHQSTTSRLNSGVNFLRFLPMDTSYLAGAQNTLHFVSTETGQDQCDLRSLLRPSNTAGRVLLWRSGRHQRLGFAVKPESGALLPSAVRPQGGCTFQPVALLARLCALIPPPYFNLVRYFGPLSSVSPLRRPVSSRTDCCASNRPPVRPRRMQPADMLARVFGFNVLACPCGSRFRPIAVITQRSRQPGHPGRHGPVKLHLSVSPTPPFHPRQLTPYTANGPIAALARGDVPVRDNSLHHTLQQATNLEVARFFTQDALMTAHKRARRAQTAWRYPQPHMLVCPMRGAKPPTAP
ncbi:MAG: hypothetical protein ACI9WU_002484 [Myxococcota bacterium]|jgi:hypothetical protein